MAVSVSVKTGILGTVILSTLFATSCAVDDTGTATSAVTRGASSLDPPVAPAPGRQAVLAPPTVAVAGKLVGYYEMFFGSGQPYEVAPITSGGGIPVTIFDPDATALAGLNTLFVTNQDNFGFGFGYTARLAEIQAAVQAGMILVIHDRTVSGIAGILPGGGAITALRDFTESADINIHDGSTVVTAGLDDTSMDNGNSSSHGFTFAASLPAKSKQLLSATTPDHLVTFCYPFGKGAVIYSTIPLDFYLQGLGNDPPRTALATIYAPNVVRYALAGACAQRGIRPTPN